MEAYAGFAEHTDMQVMRIIEALEDMGKYEDTLFIYIAGDNGASAEGGLDGTFNELMALNGIPQVLEDILPRLDEIGGPTSFNHFPVGWAHAMNTPFQYTKQVASHLRRHPQRAGRELAQGHRGPGRGTRPVAPHHRHRAHHPGSSRSARALPGQRRRAETHRGREHGLQL